MTSSEFLKLTRLQKKKGVIISYQNKFLYLEWYSNGKDLYIKQELDENKERHGKRYQYYTNNRICILSEWNHGKREGKTFLYDYWGDLDQILTYKDDVLIDTEWRN